MSYNIVTTKNFDITLKKLDRPVQKFILNYIITKLQNCDNLRLYGSGQMFDESGLWRYYIADYKLICDIKENELVLVTVKAAHSRDAYKRVL